MTQSPTADAAELDMGKAAGPRLRVLLTSQYFWPEVFPINDLAQGLVELGHSVTILTGLPNFPSGRTFPGYGLGGPWRETHEGINVRRVPIAPRGKGSFGRLGLNYLSYAASGCSFGLIQASGQYDVVLASQPSPLISVLPGVLLSRLKGIPLALWVQDLWPESLSIAGVDRNLIWGAMERTVRFVYRRSDMVLVQSLAFVDHATSRGVAGDRIRYLPNWAAVQFGQTDRNVAAAEDKELPPGFRVVFGGNLGEGQALDKIVEAATLLRARDDIKFIFIGDGRRRQWLGDEILRLGLSATVSCIGHRPIESMPRYFAVADALLMTLRRHDAMARTIPSKLQAYLASGRPIIAALDGEPQRIVTSSGAGLGCAAEDPAALAKIVEELASASAQAREAMGKAARRCYESDFERGKLLGNLEGWLSDLALRRPVRGPVPVASNV